MALKTAERACDRCRERRVKCDKRQPSCLRCEKLKKPCPGYDKKRKFVDEGVSLRKKFPTFECAADKGESVSEKGAEREVTTDPSPSGQGRASSFGSQIKPQVSDKSNTGSHAGQSASELQHTFNMEGPDSGVSIPRDLIPNEILDDASFDPAWFNLDPSEFYGNNDNSCGFIPNINIIDETDRSTIFPIPEAQAALQLGDIVDTWAPESQLSTSAIITDEREHEMAYLIRHFTEAIGPWMDLFDRDKHFAQIAPLKALRDALLRNAIAAVAAKQLGRTQGSKPFLGPQSQQPATMEVIEGDAEVWFYKAANYYDKAIACSRVYIQALSGSLTAPGTPGTQIALTRESLDDLLVAVSIFSLYESLDKGDAGWLQHLAGLNSLFKHVTIRQPTGQDLVPSITVGRKASLWNFARADYQAAYVNRQRTHLDAGDLKLWRNAGLQVQEDDSLYQDPSAIKENILGGNEIADLVSHTLLWIVLRVMNYLVVYREAVKPSQQYMKWLQLSSLLERWHETLPGTFQPCAQIKHVWPVGSNRARQATGLTEVFFSIDVCAAAMQLYHFARILLLLNKPLQEGPDPGDPGSVSYILSASGMDRLREFREMSNEAIKHAHQIVGIALGRPHPAVRVEMLLPLSVAGSCLEAQDERGVVVELLRAIEKDTGCSTEVRVNELMREWRWDSNSGRAIEGYG